VGLDLTKSTNAQYRTALKLADHSCACPSDHARIWSMTLKPSKLKPNPSWLLMYAQIYRSMLQMRVSMVWAQSAWD
jgi:hypothetical protein